MVGTPLSRNWGLIRRLNDLISFAGSGERTCAPTMKQAMALALLVSPLAPSSTAFLTMTPTRSFQEWMTQKNQPRFVTTSSRERCTKRRVHATRLYGDSNKRGDPAPTSVWKTAGEEAAESITYELEHKYDSPVGMSPSLLDVAAIAAVAVTIMNYLGPLDSASAAATTSTSAELVAQATSVDFGTIFAKVSLRDKVHFGTR